MSLSNEWEDQDREALERLQHEAYEEMLEDRKRKGE